MDGEFGEEHMAVWVESPQTLTCSFFAHECRVESPQTLTCSFFAHECRHAVSFNPQIRRLFDVAAELRAQST